MEKRNNNHKPASEPMGVLLSNASRKILKGTYPNKVPQTLVYEDEDYDALRSIYNGIPAPKDTYSGIPAPKELKSYQAWVLIKRELDKSTDYAFADLYSYFGDKPNKIFDGVLKYEVFKFMYYTELEKVPLFINHQYLNHLAKWRLSINK